MSATGDIVTRKYSNFRGADFRGEEINLRRSPDCLNVWKDYKHTESIRTRPGLALHTAFSAPVYGVFFFNGQMLVHSGSTLYKVQNGAKTTLCTGLREARSDSFIYGNIWYFKDGKNYLRYDGTEIKPVEGYVPTTSIARKPSADPNTPGGGTIHEDVNMLTGRRKNTFLADGGSLYYFLDAQNIDTDFKPIVKVNGKAVTAFSCDYAKGKITFETAPIAPLTDGQDNVEIEFSKTIQNYANNILKSTLLQVFDNRVFVSGNPDYPNTVWHCSLDNPTYFSDLDYYREGLDNAAVKGLVAGNNALWVFREPSQTNTTVFYHTPTIDADYGKIYPSQHSSITTGCTGKAINFNDDIVFFSERGMEGISGDITTEQAIAHRSSLVDRKMIAINGYENMILEEWNGYLFVIIGNEVFLADSRAMLTNENHAEYEWYFWELDKEITSARTHGGELYLGSADGVYTLSDYTKNIESYWVTPLDKFGAANKMKTSNKKGCVVEAIGEKISVYAKTNKETEFDLIDTFNNVTDAFVCRIKKKKWKDIQLKFYSKKRFSLEAATLEAFIGGYLK